MIVLKVKGWPIERGHGILGTAKALHQSIVGLAFVLSFYISRLYPVPCKAVEEHRKHINDLFNSCLAKETHMASDTIETVSLPEETGIETHGIERVSPATRTHVRIRDNFTMWLAANLVISTLALGTLASFL